MLITRKIYVTFQRHGVHCYPTAPEEVAYLRDPHRHLFKFKVTLEVSHNERDVEFHMMQNKLEAMYDTGVLQLSAKSCETLAEELLTTVIALYPDRAVEVEVSEDGECGAILSYTLHQ